MKLVVISPADVEPRESAVLAGLFAAGLERYHVRKPGWSRADLERWLRALPVEWRPCLVLHQHHTLIDELGLGGRHWRDDASAPAQPPASAALTSRSCHTFATVQAALGRYDSVFFGPVFPSLAKPGHGPRDDFNASELTALLSRRSPADRRTAVIALGGVTAETAPRCRALGFDGIAVLGAVWQAADPVSVFHRLKTALSRHAA
jgi:thiamine-phosphate pyrophosphorylase